MDFSLKKLTGKTLIYLIATITNGLIPFLLLPVLTRTLTPEDYGLVSIFMVIIQIFSVFAGLSIYGSANRKYFDEDIQPKDMAVFIGSCTAILVCSSVFLLLFIIVFEDFLLRITTLPVVWLYLAFFAVVLSFFTQIFHGQLQIRGHAIKFAIYQIFQSLMNAGLSIYLVVYADLESDGRMIAITLTLIVFGLISIFLMKISGFMTFTYKSSYIKEALSFGLPLVPHSIGFLLVSVIDRLVIGNIAGLTQLGYFMVAVQVAAALSLIFEACNTAFMPWLYEHLKNAKKDNLRKIVKLTYLCFLIIIIGVLLSFFIGPSFMILYAGESYYESAKLLPWLVVGQSFVGMYYLVVNYIFYSKKTGYLSLITVTTGALNILLIFIFFPKFGLIGAAYASATALFLRFLLTWYLANKKYKMDWGLRN